MQTINFNNISRQNQCISVSKITNFLSEADATLFGVADVTLLLTFPPMTNNGSGGSVFVRAGLADLLSESFPTILIVLGCFIGWDDTLLGGFTKLVVEVPLVDGFGR